ncbi:MAG: response regulator [Verrucomicrobiota bacterium]
MNNKVLLIEDDEFFANVYRNKLLLDGFDVDVAHDGEAGLERVRSFRPDAVLLDLILPRMSGVDVIKQLRLDTAHPGLPIIVFSNTYLTGVVQEAWKAGATKCLAKASCSPSQVIKTIRQALEDGSKDGGAPAAARPAPAAAQYNEAEFAQDLRQLFLEELPETLVALRSQLQLLVKSDNETLRVQNVEQLYRRVRTLNSSASVVGMFHISQMAEALEALLKELQEKPKSINVSTLRTIAAAVDFLGFLFTLKDATNETKAFEGHVLVVDDDAISRRAIGYALEKVRLKSMTVENPVLTLRLVEERRFDLVFLDVDMPGMNGFELCTKLRELPAYRRTPVVFVTGLNDFESRTNSAVSGGNDLIAKPFLFMELAVKALVFILRTRLENPRG